VNIKSIQSKKPKIVNDSEFRKIIDLLTGKENLWCHKWQINRLRPARQTAPEEATRSVCDEGAGGRAGRAKT